MRGYRSDWSEFTAWCTRRWRGHDQWLPHRVGPRRGEGWHDEPARLSAIRFAHQLRDPYPIQPPELGWSAVWEGIRRKHGPPTDQAAPLMPPLLLDVLDACPTTRTWKTRPAETDLAGLRDRALLLIGFFAALRRSELAALTVGQLAEHPHGLVLALPHSKTNQYGLDTELVALPRAGHPARCPVTALTTWLDAAAITDGPVLRPISKGNRTLSRRLHPESINDLVQTAVHRVDPDATDYSAHSLRAGFVTYAHLRGASDRAIAHQTRHRSLATVGTYVRIHEAWADNPATQLGL